MKVIVCENKHETAKESARIFQQAIRSNPSIVLGLATGGTPVDMYRELIRLQKEEGLDFSRVVTFNLDEYLGLSADHDQSYRYFMDKMLFDHVNIDKSNTYVLNGLAKDPETECRQFEDAISKAGNIDLQLLGIGSNGHVAFNEPGSGLDSRTRVVNLTPKTIEDNARFFKSASDVPRQALTMGIATILETKKVVLIATGSNKAVAVSKAVNGPITSQIPASCLQHQSDCTFVIDKQAALDL
ncbi:MAG: glucosamine-6-phosphate deaminase [Candidatus Omnitrophota bacterium]|nr:glucosamine-6-phosphate deaminase [Candidatus Omnitrophota bacterium]